MQRRTVILFPIGNPTAHAGSPLPLLAGCARTDQLRVGPRDADVARASDPVREVYQHRITAVVDAFTPAMYGAEKEKRQKAWTLLASIVGAITIARALPSGDQAQSILEAVLDTAMKSITDET